MKSNLNFLIVCIVLISGCVSSSRNVTQLNEATAVYSCIDPEIILAGREISVKFYELKRGELMNIEQKCESRVLAVYGNDIDELGKIGGTLLYILQGGVSFGVVPVFDIVGSTIGHAFGKHGTHCKNVKKNKIDDIREKQTPPGTFKGFMKIVKVNQPDWVRDFTYHDEPLSDFEVPVDISMEGYLVQLNGWYKTKNTECSVDRQLIVSP